MRKIMLKSTLCLSLMMLLCSAAIHAQALTSEDIKSLMLKDWERSKAYTLEYLNTMPADKYGFKATDSVRSFAQQMLHLAAAQAYIVSNLTTDKPGFLRADLETSAGTQSKDSVVYLVTASYDYVIKAVKNTDVQTWGEKKKIFGQEASRYSFLSKAFEHQAHHRGQTTIYIRLAGVKPPNEKLF